MIAFEIFLQQNGFKPSNSSGQEGYKHLSTMNNCFNTWYDGHLKVVIGLTGAGITILEPKLLDSSKYDRMTNIQLYNYLFA